MNAVLIIVNVLSLAAIALIVWHFQLYRREGAQAAEVAGV
jgi:hypothetical protein